MPNTNIPHTYDQLFDQLRGDVPLQYMRALAWMESGMNPRNKTGSHWGLFQVGPENLADYNAAHKTSYTSDQRLDPAINTRIFVWEMGRIMRSLGLAGGGASSNWEWDPWPQLLTMGWNAGWSQRAGVRHVLDWLRARGLPLDYDTVAEHAAEAGAASTLSDKRKQEWQKGVVALYRALEAAPLDPIGPAAAGKLDQLNKQTGKVDLPIASGTGSVAPTTTQSAAPAGGAPSGKQTSATTAPSDWLWLALLLAIAALDVKRRF